MQTIALIPAYRPVDRMIPLIKQLRELGFDTVIVDDGSGSGYDAVFDEARSYAEVLRYTPNRGKGEALKHGLRFIEQNYKAPYKVVTADADGQHRIEDIVKVSEAAEQNPQALVLGKRILGKNAPLKSKLGNGLTKVNYRLSSGRNIHETQTGLRGFSDRLFPRFLTLPGHRYEYEIDMMLSASELDIIEVDIKTIYFDNNAASHFRPIHDTISLNKEFIRYKIPSLIAGCTDYAVFTAAAILSGAWLLPSTCARVFCLILKYILNKTIGFSEKASAGRYILTSLIILILDTLTMWGLVSIGTNIFVAKLLSGILMIGVSIITRMIFMKIKYRR